MIFCFVACALLCALSLYLSGPLLGSLFRLLFKKLTKDVKKYIQKNLNAGKPVYSPNLNLNPKSKSNPNPTLSLSPSHLTSSHSFSYCLPFPLLHLHLHLHHLTFPLCFYFPHSPFSSLVVAGKPINIQLAISTSTITSGLKYSLATGNWGDRKNATRAGVSQVPYYLLTI